MKPILEIRKPILDSCRHYWIDYHPFGETIYYCEKSCYKDSNLCKKHYFEELIAKTNLEYEKKKREITEIFITLGRSLAFFPEMLEPKKQQKLIDKANSLDCSLGKLKDKLEKYRRSEE